MPMSGKDKALTRVFMAATFHHWDILPGDLGLAQLSGTLYVPLSLLESSKFCRAWPQVLRRRLHLSGSQGMCEAPHCVRPSLDDLSVLDRHGFAKVCTNHRKDVCGIACLLQVAAAHRVAGYGPCLAATNHLHAAKVLPVIMLFTRWAEDESLRCNCCHS